jgi:hypothetical protein
MGGNGFIMRCFLIYISKYYYSTEIKEDEIYVIHSIHVRNGGKFNILE